MLLSQTGFHSCHTLLSPPYLTNMSELLQPSKTHAVMLCLDIHPQNSLVTLLQFWTVMSNNLSLQVRQWNHWWSCVHAWVPEEILSRWAFGLCSCRAVFAMALVHDAVYGRHLNSNMNSCHAQQALVLGFFPVNSMNLTSAATS